ncbi:MAG: hypothetical protein IEMM0008_1322 [bacterium]|nr:MAG: hypothetical protein IEMM0008_1322 [bacterium]
MKEKGINEKNIKINAITSRKIYRKGKYYNYTNEIEYYKVTQSAEVTTNDVDKARRVSGLISELIKDGLDIEASTPKYYVSSLDSVKVELIAKATGNGHQRALIMAQKTGGTVGSLSSATQGVFQITKPNSTQISGYGNTIHLPLIK